VNGFGQHVAEALASGSIFALLALGLLLTYRASGVVNLAQGELATLSAFVCGALVQHGWRLWAAFGVTVALSFAAGWAIERLLVRTARHGPELGLPILILGLLLATAGLEAWIWGGGHRSLESPFSPATVHLVGLELSKRQLGVAGLALAAVEIVLLVLWRTRLGLGIRATAAEPGLAHTLGLRVEAMRAIAWALALALGSVAGVLAATQHGLHPGLLRGGMVYALAGLVLGGLESPLGVVLGTLAVTVGVHLLADYVHWVGTGFRLTIVAVVLLVTLLVRPLRTVERA
jgi:branched-chain amino acid transport system permease protein